MRFLNKLQHVGAPNMQSQSKPFNTSVRSQHWQEIKQNELKLYGCIHVSHQCCVRMCSALPTIKIEADHVPGAALCSPGGCEGGFLKYCTTVDVSMYHISAASACALLPPFQLL